MATEVVVHIYNRILAIKRNKIESLVVVWMNLESVIQSEVSQKVKNKYHILTHTHIYIWNLEKWYWWTYFQGRNRDTDVENWLVEAEEGEDGTNLDSSTDIHTRPGVK